MQKKDNKNLKTKANQNCQKIKLHGTLTTEKLKKHSSRPVGVVDMGSQMERTHDKVADCAGEARAG